jgi:hypothetical protein
MESEHTGIVALRKHYKDIITAKDLIYQRFGRFFWNDGKIIELMNLDADMELVLNSIASYYEERALETILDLRDKIETLEAGLLEAKKAAYKAKPKPTAKIKKTR